MYHAGSIIYFPLFYFKNGAKPKAKYFLVLKETGNNLVLISLPSSVDHLPRFVDRPHGCMEIPEGSICCYIFKAGQVITENAWAVDKDTYLYGEQLDEYEISMLDDIYPIVDIDYEIIGTLVDKELAAITDYFATSATVKRKYKRLLAG